MTPSLLVTDTHPFIWYVCGEFHRLPKKVKQAFDDAVEGRAAIYIPLVVLWEFSLAVKAGKVLLSASIDEYVAENFFAKAISVMSIEIEDILCSHRLGFTSDPFDALIVAMTMRVNCPLITGDAIIHANKPCELYWD